MALCAMLGGCGGPGAGGPGVANAGDATANTQCGADLQRDPNDPYISGQHPQFPRHKFITGAGESCQGKEDADTRAKTAVSSQISSQLQGIFTTMAKQWREETEDRQTMRFVEKILSQTSTRTSFSQAQLIEIVKHDPRGGLFRSFAALDRQKTAQVLQPAAETARQRVEQRMEHCRKAYRGGDLKALRSMIPRVTRAVQLYDRRLSELAMVKGDTAMYARLSPLKKLAKLEKWAWNLRQGRRWYVALVGDRPATRKAAQSLHATVSNVLRGKGQKVAPWPAGVKKSADDVGPLASHLGDDAAASYAMLGKFQVETEPQPIGGGKVFHICVCKISLTGHHVGSGRVVKATEVESERKGGGDTVAQACERCAEYLKKSVKKGF